MESTLNETKSQQKAYQITIASVELAARLGRTVTNQVTRMVDMPNAVWSAYLARLVKRWRWWTGTFDLPIQG